MTCGNCKGVGHTAVTYPSGAVIRELCRACFGTKEFREPDCLPRGFSPSKVQAAIADQWRPADDSDVVGAFLFTQELIEFVPTPPDFVDYVNSGLASIGPLCTREESIDVWRHLRGE